MFAVEFPAGLRVLELLQRRLPVDKQECSPVVLRVTSRAGLAAAARLHDGCVITTSSGDASSNLCVAFKAPERGIATRLMTFRAVCGAFKAGMRPRKRARRNLRQ